jgi:hypothetical protein
MSFMGGWKQPLGAGVDTHSINKDPQTRAKEFMLTNEKYHGLI